MIKTKSVYSPIQRNSDGLRILATRARGRGLRASRYDVWMANLAPSEKLLADFRARRIAWSKFIRLYRAELMEGGGVDRRNRIIKNHGQKFTLRLLQRLGRKGQTITLMCHCDEEQMHCHRRVLQKLLKSDI